MISNILVHSERFRVQNKLYGEMIRVKTYYISVPETGKQIHEMLLNLYLSIALDGGDAESLLCSLPINKQ